MEKKYIPTITGIYINYFIHGIAIIILAQNTLFLQKQLDTNAAGILFVISGLGIGKVVSQLLVGFFSDRYGRKICMMLALLCYCSFLGGILLSTNVYMAFAFSCIAGVGNSFLDSGGTTSLLEIMDHMQGTASILTKFCIGVGQFSLPLVIGFIIANNLYYGISFLAYIVILVIVFFILLKAPFPPVLKKTSVASTATNDDDKKASATMLDMIALNIIAFTSTATFYLFIQWITTFGRQVAHLDEISAQGIMSYYSIGSIIAVALTAYLVKGRIKPVRMIFIYPAACCFVLYALCHNPTPLMCNVLGFFVGVTAAGGVLQLAVAVLVDFYPYNKGKITGIFFTISGLSMFIIPLITGHIASDGNITNVFYFDILITAIGALLALYINIRYNQIKSLDEVTAENPA